MALYNSDQWEYKVKIDIDDDDDDGRRRWRQRNRRLVWSNTIHIRVNTRTKTNGRRENDNVFFSFLFRFVKSDKQSEHKGPKHYTMNRRLREAVSMVEERFGDEKGSAATSLPRSLNRKERLEYLLRTRTSVYLFSWIRMNRNRSLVNVECSKIGQCPSFLRCCHSDDADADWKTLEVEHGWIFEIFLEEQWEWSHDRIVEQSVSLVFDLSSFHYQRATSCVFVAERTQHD